MSVYGSDLDIFEILVKQNYKKVYQTVYTYTKDKYISEDAIQQAFMIAYKKLHQLNSKDKFASWVISIALNEAKRMLNDKNNDMISSITDGHLHLMPDINNYDIELKEDIGNALNKLKQKDMEILVFKYFADLTVQQIADLLGNKLSSTKVRLHRAKEAFRKMLDNDSNESLGG